MARSRSTALAVCALVGALGFSVAAKAERPKVAVLPFNGPQGVRAQGDAVRALRKKADILSQALWNATAKKLFATTHSASDIAAVANDLGVKVVVSGAVKRDGGWVLVVSVRQGASGKSVEKLKYPLRGPRLDPATMRRLADEIGPAVERVLAGAAASGPEEADTEPPPDPNAKNIEEESPLDKKAEKEEAEEERIERPAWTPYIDGSIALLISGRNFGFDQSGLPQFRSSAAAGLRFDVTGYPLAFLGTRPGGGANALSGIGVGATLDLVFWPDSIPCTRDMSGKCITTTDHYGTRERRFEAGLRWHWNFLNAPIRPDLLISLQYGTHTFSIDKKPDNSDVGPPDVAYSYVTIGAGLRVPFADWIAIFGGFNLHILVDSGSVQSQSEFGPGGGYGVRLALGLELKLYKGLTARASAFYEQFGLSFNGGGAKTTTGGATDQYYGGVLSIGYVF